VARRRSLRCALVRSDRTFLTEFEIFSTLEIKPAIDSSHYVRTSSSTLGPAPPAGRPAAVPVLAMDVNPSPDVNCDQCGDTFYTSDLIVWKLTDDRTTGTNEL
jgi:hypothetical protein